MRFAAALFSLTEMFMEINKTEITADEKKKALYIRQKNTLDTFLRTKAITKAQYDKSLGDLTEKMGMQQVLEELENKEN